MSSSRLLTDKTRREMEKAKYWSDKMQEKGDRKFEQQYLMKDLFSQQTTKRGFLPSEEADCLFASKYLK